MIEYIFLIICVLSLAGLIFMLYKKIPILNQLPEIHEGVQKENLINVYKTKIKALAPDKVILLKFLSKIRVLILKSEKIVDGWLQNMRKIIHHQKKQSGGSSSNNSKTNGNPPKIPPL